MTFKTVYLKDITINLDSKRKPLNATERKALKGKNLYPYCGANGILDYIDEYIFDQEILCLAEDGGSWGYNEKCCYIMNEPCWVNNHAHVLAPKSNVNIKYLYYYLNYVDLNKYITGTTRGKLTKSALEKIQIKLPSLSNQNEIVDLLDKAQELIDKRNAQIEALDQLTQSVFLEMFGDPIINNKKFQVIKGKDLFTLSSGKFISSNEKSKDGKYPIYGGNGINGYCDSYLIDMKTIVIGRVGVYCGNVHLTEPSSWITDNAIYIKDLKKEYNLTFLYYLFRNMNFNRFADYSGQPKITQKPLYELDYMAPDMKLQKLFADKVKRIEHQKELLKSGLIELENMYNALMQKAFKGELFTI